MKQTSELLAFSGSEDCGYSSPTAIESDESNDLYSDHHLHRHQNNQHEALLKHPGPRSSTIIDISQDRHRLEMANQQQPEIMPELIGAIDQGTSSTRFLAFENRTKRLVASSQIEIKRITPKEGWVEIDPMSIMESVYATMMLVREQLRQKYPASVADLGDQCDRTSGQLLKCIGICNQRESAVVWDSQTGLPLYNVIVWLDNRTKDIVDQLIEAAPGRDFNAYKDKTGLPMSTYFSAFKLKWLIENVEAVAEALHENRLMFGTVDSWIVWNLTGRHETDVTNASRTFLMDIETLQWDKSLCKMFNVPMHILPKIRASADDFGRLMGGPFKGAPITGVIGDQSAALFGHHCLQAGQTKATFGTGCFIMQNIGAGSLASAMRGVQRESRRGLITTVGYQLRDQPASYVLEGSIKIAGAALTWLRDNLQLIENYEECDKLVSKTTHSAGVFFVPALGGLYSPYWDPNAAGLFIGLSQFTRREHLVRATFDSIAFQTNDTLSLMRGVSNGLKIDGGLCKSDNLCQILADITGREIVRPSMCETSALGAAMVAACGANIWSYDSMLASSGASSPIATTPMKRRFNMSTKVDSKEAHHFFPHDLIFHQDDSDDQYSPMQRSISFKDHHHYRSISSDGSAQSNSSSGSSNNNNNNNNNHSHCHNRNQKQHQSRRHSLHLGAYGCTKANGKSKHNNTTNNSTTSTVNNNDTSAVGHREHSHQRQRVQREELIETWRQAVGRSMQWTRVHHEEERKIDYLRLASMPISMYLFLSFGMVALSGLFRSMPSNVGP